MCGVAGCDDGDVSSRHGGAVILLLVLFAVSGCAATPASVPAENVPIESAPTPTPTPTPTPQWTIAYGGGCDAMLTGDQVDTILGSGATDYAAWFQEHVEPIAPEAEPPMSPDAEGTAGGLSCTWVASPDADRADRRLTILALPQSVAEPAAAAALAEPECDWMYDTRVCRLGAARDGLWVMADLSPMGEEDAAPTDTLDAAIAAALDNAGQYPAAVPAPPTGQRWPIVACEQLGREMALEELLGADYWSGYWEGSRQREDDIYEHAGVQQFCQYGTGESAAGVGHHIVSITSQPDGAWMWGRTGATSGDVIAVEGARDAVQMVTPRDGGRAHDRVLATDGTNIIRVSVEGGELAAEVAARAIAALGD